MADDKLPPMADDKPPPVADDKLRPVADDKPPPVADDDDVPPADPFEADLVAYLDGELDAEAVRRVEARLAADPEARMRAMALKKTYELLDYLPRPEPSANFTARTLEKLPVLKSAALPAETAAASPPTGLLPDRPDRPPPAASPVTAAVSSLPVAGAVGGSRPHSPTTADARYFWLGAAAVAVVCVTCATGTYLAVSELRRPSPRTEAPAAPPEELPISDHRVVACLPLYCGADDLDFVKELSHPEFFGEHPAVATDPELRLPPVEPEVPTGPNFDKLAAAFKALPVARQQAIRELDRQLYALDGATRDRLLRVLEVYAAWLERLEKNDRKAVLDAPTAANRLDLIRRLRTQQWLQSLPPPLRAEYAKLSPQQQSERLQRWREEEAARHEEWSFVRGHADDIVANKAPWPFDSTARQKEVIDFFRTSFRTDDPRRSRLNPFEIERHNGSLGLAEKFGGWWWYLYGKSVYDLTRKYEAFLLPEPATGEPVTNYAQLGPAARFFEKGRGRTLTQGLVGRWPDFALAVHNFASTEKNERIPLPPLGPARPDEFKEPLRSFVLKELVPALSPTQLKELKALEGRWPEYPREVVRLAKQVDLSAPGLMLPGSPRRWETTYSRFAAMKP